MSRRREPNSSKQTGGTVAKSVGEYYTKYIDDLVDSGKYLTVAEVLREALRLHERESIKSLASEGSKA